MRELDRSIRRPYPYATSHPLEEVDGRSLLKDLREPVASKPGFLHDRFREIKTYRHILAPAGIGPRLHAAGDGLLLIEKVGGTELWQIGEVETWCRVARWLAGMHRALVVHADAPWLLRYDALWYRLWLDRARAFAGDLGPVERVHEAAVKRLLALPRTVIHGELYPSNILVAGERICPVDWEMAASGPGIVDLAALASGFNSEETEAILAAYGDADREAFECARLHLAVRWLGWSRVWSPPPEHEHDWRSEARAAAERLGEALR